jgi:hexosaminidase
LNPVSPLTFDVVASVLSEASGIFPDEYVHLGADEVNFNCWNSSASVRSYVTSRNMSLSDLLGEFERRVHSIAVSSGKKAIFWQEIVDEQISLPRESTMIQVGVSEFH